VRQVADGVDGHTQAAQGDAIVDVADLASGEPAADVPAFEDGLRDGESNDAARIVLEHGQTLGGLDDTRPRLRTHIGPPEPQRGPRQDGERKVDVAGVRRAPCDVAQLQHPARVTEAPAVEDLPQPLRPAPVQFFQLGAYGGVDKTVHQTLAPIRNACTAARSRRCPRRADMLVNCADLSRLEIRRHHGPTAERFVDPGLQLFGYLVVRPDDRLGPVSTFGGTAGRPALQTAPRSPPACVGRSPRARRPSAPAGA
jgi:hypothetical protein